MRMGRVASETEPPNLKSSGRLSSEERGAAPSGVRSGLLGLLGEELEVAW